MKRLVIPVGAAAIIGTSGFAFMASNSVPISHAGGGGVPNNIQGYSVSGVTYTTVPDSFHQSDVTRDFVHKVTFTLNHAATTVQAQVNSVPFRDCKNDSGNTWTCGQKNAGAGVPTKDSNQLYVEATQ
jgi:hypothetical protein